MHKKDSKPNTHLYNILLDEFMEKKAELLCKQANINKEDYYNKLDKRWILYELDSSLAKQIWKKIRKQILYNNVCGLRWSTCPFCLYSEHKFYNDTRRIIQNVCHYCPYPDHHNGYACSESPIIQTLIQFTPIRNTITNEDYVKIVREVERDMFSKTRKVTSLIESELKIRVCDDTPEVTNVLFSDSLYDEYDFIARRHSNNEIIRQCDINDVASSSFDRIHDERAVTNIFEMAEKCDINPIDTSWNFYVYNDGNIKIGNKMKYIKEHLEELKHKYDLFKNENLFNIIEFTVKQDNARSNDESSSYLYNIILDEFMEKKAELICKKVESISKQDYYNELDKRWILHRLDSSLAKHIWEKIKKSIKIGESGLTIATCPFCLYSKYLDDKCTGNVAPFMCYYCPYINHHNGYRCDRSPIIQAIDENTDISNQEYVEIIQEVENNVYGPKTKNITSSIESKGYRIEGVCNKVGYFKTSNLHKSYDFTNNIVSDDVIINRADIIRVATLDFSDIEDDTINMIIDLAKRCDIHSTTWNFCVYQDGTIKIGGDMALIRNNIEEIERRYKETREQKCYNIITFSMI